MKKHKVILKFTKACYDSDCLGWYEVADTTFYNWAAEAEANFDVVIKICRLKNHLDLMKSKIVFLHLAFLYYIHQGYVYNFYLFYLSLFFFSLVTSCKESKSIS